MPPDPSTESLTIKDISVRANAILSEEISRSDFRDPLVWLYSRFAYLAGSTSESIRLLLAGGHTIPAIALARVRLEQLIVTSYLLHEDTEKGVTPYLKHFPIDSYKSNKGAIEHVELAKHLSPEVHNRTKDAARDAKRALDPAFDGTDAALNRSTWTKLDLLSMAKRRDVLAKESKGPSVNPLELSYLSFYRDFSSVIHSSSMAISPEFVRAFVNEKGAIRYEGREVWTSYLSMVIGHWDIVTTYEILKMLSVDRNAELKALSFKLGTLRDEFFKAREAAESSSS